MVKGNLKKKKNLNTFKTIGTTVFRNLYHSNNPFLPLIVTIVVTAGLIFNSPIYKCPHKSFAVYHKTYHIY